MDPILILLFILLFGLSAFFSGTEIALMSLPSHKIDALVKAKRFGSKHLEKIKKNNDKLLITILIGNNLANVYTASLATVIAISIGETSGFEQAKIIGISTGIVTFFILLFGEIIPKSFATKNATNIALKVAPIYSFLMIILYPIILFIEIIIKLFTSNEKVERITGEEIKSFIDMGRNSGTLEDYEHDKIKNILEFSDITVEEIMTPRVKIEAISSIVTVDNALEYYMNHTHSRIPVYKETIDKIDHTLTIRDLIVEVNKGNGNIILDKLSFSEVMKVPLNQPIDNLLKTFQKTHKHIAIVIDEYGGVAGLTTLEDVIEEIFGEIRDETDKEFEEITPIKGVKGGYIVKSYVLIEDFLEKYGLQLEDIGLHNKEFSGENLSYVITHKLERFPESGEIIAFKIFSDLKKYDNKALEIKTGIVKHGQIGEVEVKLVKAGE